MDGAFAQDRLANQVRWDWLDAAWATARCDRDQVGETVVDLYQAAGLDRPAIVWVDSPHELAAAYDALSALDSPTGDHPLRSTPARDALARLRHEVAPCLFRSGVAHVLWCGSSDRIGDGIIPATIRWQVADALADTDAPFHVTQQGLRVWARAAASVGVRRGETPVLSAESCCMDAILWAACLAVSGIRDPVIERTLAVLRGAGWFAPFDQLALLADRPSDVRFDSDSPLAASREFHAGGAPAIRWHDGAGLNWWHGLELPDDFWRWSVADVVGCGDAELRRVALANLDPRALTGQLAPAAVADDPANPGQVVELYELPGVGGGAVTKFVRVANASPDMDGTRRMYLLQVSPDTTDPIEAVAASFGVDAATYSRLLRAS